MRTAARLVGKSGHTRLVSSLAALRDYFAKVKDRCIRLDSLVPPVVILTDAAAETAAASLGAVMVDPANGRYEFLAKRICPKLEEAKEELWT